MADDRAGPIVEITFVLVNHSSESFGSIQLHSDKCLAWMMFETKYFTFVGSTLISAILDFQFR